jgi:hypothetical protein
MATNVREARRKKIMDRGADRLALIAGRIQTLPPHDENTTSSASDPSSQPLISNDRDLQPQVSNQTTGTPLSLSLYIYLFVLGENFSG